MSPRDLPKKPAPPADLAKEAAPPADPAKEAAPPADLPDDITGPPTDRSNPALAEALAAVGDRWTLLLIAALLEGPLRFGELQERLPGIAPNVLSQRLRHLQQQGLVLTEAYSARPPRFVYELSSRGHELAEPLRLLAHWADRQGEREAPRHAACGSPLELVWYCPTCREPVTDAADEGELSYL
ncbi:MAG TPA: helix-turn-helix domain-containing protein [Solirubrobacteraceae bacterium]|nr:helix-turn-helix domain-containing protein [Solirubrobacteraceae bacterium]